MAASKIQLKWDQLKHTARSVPLQDTQGPFASLSLMTLVYSRDVVFIAGETLV